MLRPAGRGRRPGRVRKTGRRVIGRRGTGTGKDREGEKDREGKERERQGGEEAQGGGGREMDEDR